MEKNVLIVRYSPSVAEQSLTAKVVACYRQVFADEPWHEWLQCPHCKKYWGVKQRTLLQGWNFRHCDTDLVDFWSASRVTDDLFREITNMASCYLAMIEKEVIGFCWGYPIPLDELEEKLGVELDLRLGNIQVAYQDEVGVLPEFRGRKIAKSMIKHRLQDFLARDLRIGIVRTRKDPEPSVTFLWYQRIGYRLLASYDDGRVVMGRELGDLMELL